MATHLGQPTDIAAQERDRSLQRGQVTDAATGAPITEALIELGAAEENISILTDSLGRFRIGPLTPGRHPIRVWRIGYLHMDTVLALAPGPTDVSLALRVQPIALRPLTVLAERAEGGQAAERALFEREVVPGVVGISRAEINALPALAESDVLRSLQALPGVIALNDLSAELHVRGGGPDQNLFLLDGARIFAPYHMFGIFGTFNSDAMGRVDFFRGALPARFGGALSSVVNLEQRSATGDTATFAGGMSLLGARLTGSGKLPVVDGEWLFAARRTHADLIAETFFDEDFPYAFYDVQGRLTLVPAPRHQVRASFFTSSDRFRMLPGMGSNDLRTRWRNAAGSMHWNWAGGGAWSAAATAWGSSYHGTLEVGSGPELHPTRSRVGVGGLRIEATRRSEALGLRVGLDAEAGRVALVGADQPASYLQGTHRAKYMRPAAYAEVERWVGSVRLAPGLRAGYETSDGRWLVEPRMAARMYPTDDLSITIGAGRTQQVLSTIRDDRFILPGPPFWLLHPRDAPVSTADGVDVALDGWHGREWSYHFGAYGRRFTDVPRWRPQGTRELARLAYDDGHALGTELMVRRHEGTWTGWLAYGLSRVRFAAPGDADYFAAWDRRHAIDLALLWKGGERLSFSTRLTYGSGLPFWPIIGSMHTSRLVPIRGTPAGRWSGPGPLERVADAENELPIWADEQRRLPSLFRLDVGAEYRFRLGGFEITPYANILNVTGRTNVLYYELRSQPWAGPSLVPSRTGSKTRLEPVEPFEFAILPTIGFDIRF